MGWIPVDKLAVALFNFSGQGEHQLSLEMGDMVCVLEKSGEWYRGHHFNQPSELGIFPSGFVHFKEHSTTKIGAKDCLVPAENLVTMEATQLLREWRQKLRQLYLSGQKASYRKLLEHMEEIISSRRNILKSNATLDVVQSMKTKLTAKLDYVNNLLSLPVSPRDDDGNLLNCYDTSLQMLCRVHKDRKMELDNQISQTGALNKKQNTTSSSLHVHHLFVRINKVDHEPPEECEVYYFLYDADNGKQISERFMMHAEGGGGRGGKRNQKHEKKIALFTDLGSKDIDTSGMYLICQFIRRGKMLLDDKKNIAQNPYRRPYACGVLEVSNLLQAPEEQDRIMHVEDFKNASFSIPLYLCAANHESDFSSFHSNIFRKTGGKSGQKPGCAITMTVKAFHGDINEIKATYPNVLDQPLELVHKLGFPDVILPGDVRNDIYITVEHGTFEKGQKRSERNVEVAIEVIDGSRQIIPRAIVLGAGGTPVNEYESFVFYHNNTPRWSETIKLSIPFDKLPDSHLRICFRHVAKAEAKDKSEKTFAFTFMKMMNDDGSIIQDGAHELYVYKADHKRWFDPNTYLSHASCKADVLSNRSSQTFSSKTSLDMTSNHGGTSLSRSFKETIVVSTLTCSTKLTQKIELLMLLKWKQRQRDLGVVLTNMLHIGGEEVVKFLQDTLDCLFEILNSNQEIYGDKIFEVLVSIFGLMLDDKYQHFTTVLDIYISKHFSATLAHRFLVFSLEHHIQEYGHIPKLHSKLCRVLKSLQYLFRFMVQSHTLYKKANKTDDPSFPVELSQVFSSLSGLMSHQENNVKDVYIVQSIVLCNLPSVLPDVALVLSEDTIAILISQFLDSIRNTHATLPRDKLQFMLNILDGPVKLFHSPEARKNLVQTFVSHLISYMDHTMPKTDYKPEVQSNADCMRCIGKLLETLADQEVGATEEDIEKVVTLILSLLRLSKLIIKKNPLYRENMINLIGLLDLMQNGHYATFFASQKSTFGSALKDFLNDFMLALSNILKAPIFPNSWVSMILIQSRGIAKALANISKALLDSFLQSHSFNPLIWDEFFSICTEFLTQPLLQLEQFSLYRKNFYLQQFGDSRVKVGKQVILMWHKLSSHKGQFIPDLINPILKISLLKQRELRRISLPLIFDVIKCEQQASNNFKRVETEVLDKMDELVFSGQGDEEYKEMFGEILRPLCGNCAAVGPNGVSFIETVTRLIALVLDYRNVPTDDYHKGRRMGCMLNLLQFYKDIEKEELYVKYIYKLAELHEGDQSFTEAGFTLLLHADGLSWEGGKSVPAVPTASDKYPLQNERERKEQLYMDAMLLFDRGKSWEHGIPLCQELAQLYEMEMFDYRKLSAILQKEAEFFSKIIDIQQLRVAPEYFMVGYYGKGFPLFLRNKIFIHRGQPYEKLGAFIKRLTDEFTNAEVLRTTTPPEAEMQNSNGLYLQFRTVLPVPKVHEKFKGKSVPDKIAEYYLTNEVQEFRYDRPFHKGKKNKECEFASLWIDRTTFTTQQSFPGVISWFEVSFLKELELDPLEIALETMENKNQEIQLQVAIYTANKSLSINPLSMLLNGVIDAAVMGGIGNYEKIFFNPAYFEEHPEDVDKVKRLRSLIEEQTVVLEKALALHGQRIDQSLQGLQAKLEQCFEDFQCIVYPDKKKAKVQRKVARSATIARPLPPPPSSPSSSISSLGIGHATLPSKMRRATGVPSAGKRIAAYEDTELENSNLRQKVTRKSSSPSPMTGKKNEGSPKAPSPYTSRKRLGVSPSRGDISEKRFSGSHHSSNSSITNSSDNDMYEPIADFLKESLPSQQQPQQQRMSTSISNNSVPLPSESGVSKISPPSYPAPVPPIPPKKSQARRTSNFPADEKPQDDEDEDDDEGYTQVNLEGGVVDIPGFIDSVERAPLPLLLSSSSTRSSMAGDSSDTAHGSPMKEGRKSSPSYLRGDGGGSGGGSSSHSESNSPQKMTSSTKLGKVVVPPEPKSPPPSPPTGDRCNVTPPIPISVKSPSPLLSMQGNTPPSKSPTGEQPKLPIKKKASQPYSSSTATGKHIDDDIYSFDSLDPPSQPPAPSSSKPGSVPAYDADDEIYTFDSLEQPPPLPVKVESSQKQATGRKMSMPLSPSPKPSYQEEDENVYEEGIYDYDGLEKPVSASNPPRPAFVSSSMLPPRPVFPKKASTSRISPISEQTSASSMNFQHQDNDDVYSFDTLEATPTLPKKTSIPGKNPVLQAKQSESPPVQMYDNEDEIYSFDNLEPPPRPPSSSKAGTASPLQSQSSYNDDEIYSFDTLDPPSQQVLSPATGQPNNPAPPPGGGAERKAVATPPPYVPPKTSPPLIKKRAPVPGLDPSAPPIPVKKRASTKTQGSIDLPETPDSQDNKPRPVPRPRVPTVEKRTVDAPDPTPSLPPRPSNPQLPPRPSQPQLPPKSRSNGAPPVPSKGATSRQWPPKR